MRMSRTRASRRSPDRSVLEHLEPRVLMDGDPLQIDKIASVHSACAGQAVTYTYKVESTVGGASFFNVKVVDDNATPSYTGDDFQPTFVGGDTNNNNMLDFGETWVYSKKLVPVITCGSNKVTNEATVSADTIVGGSVVTITASDTATVTINNSGCCNYQPSCGTTNYTCHTRSCSWSFKPCPPSNCSYNWSCQPSNNSCNWSYPSSNCQNWNWSSCQPSYSCQSNWSCQSYNWSSCRW